MKKFLVLMLVIVIQFSIMPDELSAAAASKKNPPVTSSPVTTIPGTIIFSEKDFGAKGDGMSNNDVAFSSLIAAVPAYSNVALEPGKQYVITQPIILTKPINIDLMGSTIVCKNSASVFTLKSDSVTIKNGVLDLNFTTHNGIRGTGYKQLLVENIIIRDLIPTATNLEGGIFLTSFTDVNINKCTFKNIINSSDPGTVDHSPAVKFVSCRNCTVKQLNADNCGVGVNIYGSENVEVSDFVMLNINNNGFYIQNSSKNLNIKGGKVNGAENGLVFNLNNFTTSILPTTVSCVGVEFSNVTNKGISLRNGSGLLVSGCSFIKNSYAVGQSSTFNGCSNIVISENTIDQTIGKIPFYFLNDINMDIYHNTFSGLLSADSFAIKLGAGCVNNNINDNYITGLGVMFWTATTA